MPGGRVRVCRGARGGAPDEERRAGLGAAEELRPCPRDVGRDALSAVGGGWAARSGARATAGGEDGGGARGDGGGRA
eukprot:5468570-Pleurochrysis_carterae.AAC.2